MLTTFIDRTRKRLGKLRLETSRCDLAKSRLTCHPSLNQTTHSPSPRQFVQRRMAQEADPRLSGEDRRIFEPSLEPLESGEPSHSTLNRRPQRGHGVSPIRSSRPGLRLFRSTYDTYTREHLSALVDSIAIEPSPSPPVSDPRDPRDWSPSRSLSDRSPSSSASRSGSGTMSSGGESRSSKRIRLSAPSPRRGPRDWGAQGRAMMDRIRVRAEESTTSASRSRTSGEDEHSGERLPP